MGIFASTELSSVEDSHEGFEDFTPISLDPPVVPAITDPSYAFNPYYQYVSPLVSRLFTPVILPPPITPQVMNVMPIHYNTFSSSIQQVIDPNAPVPLPPR